MHLISNFLTASIGNGYPSSEEDVQKTRRKYNSLGYDAGDETFGFSDQKLEHAIRKFQRDHDLKEDGVMHPKGETERALILKVAESKKDSNGVIQGLSATKDFVKNWIDMRNANTIDSDKYFHCKANYEATKRGNSGQKTAEYLSDRREMYGRGKNDYTLKDEVQDREANLYGREAAKSNKYKSAQDACSVYRVKGLNEKY